MERYRLVKGFGRQEYREEFLDGRLYMNSLGYFWSNGNEAQRDAAEGLSLEIEPMTLEALPIEFRRVQMHCAQVCPSGFASCNILCFAMDTVKNINGLPCIETLGNPRELGEYFIAIDDIDQFLKRVVCAVAAQGAEYIFSPVAYGPPALAPGRDLGNHILLEMDEAPGDAFFPDGLPGTCFGPFKKAVQYASQREWRIALYRGVAVATPYVFDIGDIRDIAHELQYDGLYIDAEIAAHNTAAWIFAQTGGNISKEELTRRFYELGNRKVKMFCTVG